MLGGSEKSVTLAKLSKGTKEGGGERAGKGQQASLTLHGLHNLSHAMWAPVSSVTTELSTSGDAVPCHWDECPPVQTSQKAAIRRGCWALLFLWASHSVVGEVLAGVRVPACSTEVTMSRVPVLGISGGEPVVRETLPRAA